MPKTDMSVNFGKWMRHRRDELRLTQAQVAKRIDEHLPEMAADKQRVSDWERGYNMPSDQYKPGIVHALEVDDVSYFYRPFDDVAAKATAPDLMARMGEGKTDYFVGLATQLVRVEAKLDLVLRAMALDAPTDEDLQDALERELSEAVEQAATPGATADATAPRPGHRARR